MTKPLWTPTNQRISDSNLHKFKSALAKTIGGQFNDYDALHRYSTEHAGDFWAYYCHYSQLPITPPAGAALQEHGHLAQAEWFAGSRCNYAQACLYPPNASDEQLAIIALDESGGSDSARSITYRELRWQVKRCADALRRSGVAKGDRVAALLPNTVETVVVLLACASQGIIFSSCSPDFGFESASARLGQIKPKILFAVPSYNYNGKTFYMADTVQRLTETIDSIEQCVLVGENSGSSLDCAVIHWQKWLADLSDLSVPPSPDDFTPLPFDHPLYILYSSGTTGAPKAIVHRTGGVMLKHHCEQAIHCDIKNGDRIMYHSTCGWMMWNWLVSGLMHGACIVLYDGNPAYPTLAQPWHTIEQWQLKFFGTSAKYLHACRDAQLQPKKLANLNCLQTIASTGSPLAKSAFIWVYNAAKTDVHLASISGGTDIVGCFLLGNPTAPVYAEQLQVPALGTDVAVFGDKGNELATDMVGDLVSRTPMPSMPLCFWQDKADKKRLSAYFAHYNNVWRHGDQIKKTKEGGYTVYGRSDCVLNPSGVRIGTAEIYLPLADVLQITEMIAVGKKIADDEVIWLFVVLQQGAVLDATLTETIKNCLRQAASPRHVPKNIFAVSQLPRTRSNKLSEMAVRQCVNGEAVSNIKSLANPEALDEILKAIDSVDS